MNVHSNTPTADVIAWLRERFVAGNMPRALIAKLDELATVEDLEAEIEQCHEQITDLEKDRENLVEELTNLRVAFVDFLDGGDPDDKNDRRDADRAVEMAQSAIERHTPK